MRGWWRFIRASAKSGWRWLIDVANHFGAGAVILGGLGAAGLSWTTSRWWIAAGYSVIVVFAAFTAGAYGEYLRAERTTAQALGYSLLATLTLLGAKREQANEWLRQLRDDDLQGTSVEAIDQVFSIFWTNQVTEIVVSRFPELAPKLHDQAGDPLVPASDDRERVFNTIQRGVRLLDEVIKEINQSYEMVLDASPAATRKGDHDALSTAP